MTLMYTIPYDTTCVVSGPGLQYSGEPTLCSGAQVRLPLSQRTWVRIGANWKYP